MRGWESGWVGGRVGEWESENRNEIEIERMSYIKGGENLLSHMHGSVQLPLQDNKIS